MGCARCRLFGSKKILASITLESLASYTQRPKNSVKCAEELYSEIQALNTKSKLVPAMPTKVNR